MMGWDYLIVLAISIIIQIALTPKPARPDPAVLEDLDLPVAEEGTPQIVIFGDCWIEGWQVLHYGNLRTQDIYGDGGK